MNNHIYNVEELLNLIEHFGFLPFFKNRIPGFSVEEFCPPELWFAADAEGPWEWKGPATRSGRCLYGKFFNGKAGFVSKEWIPDFLNYRRDGYDFDARFEDGLAAYKDRDMYEAIVEHEIILSKELKKILNYSKGGNKGFDTVITRLQMQGYVSVADFTYMTDKFGKPYGWGVAKYTTPEEQFGHEYVTSAYKKKPEESRQEIVVHLKKMLPETMEQEIQRIVRV